MTRKEYNGYTNYESWCVALWLDNDQGSQSHWQGRAEELVAAEKGDKDEATRQLADELKDEHENGNPVPDGSVFSDLMSAALSEVDWHEIAENYVNEVEVEETEGEKVEA